MQVETIIFYIAIFVLGTIFGSFIGAMTWRMHKHKNWITGRSECEHCHHQLNGLDMIPIVSYLALRGKCRYCGKKIGGTALRLELGTGIAFLVSAVLFPSMLLGTWLSPARYSLVNWQEIPPIVMRGGTFAIVPPMYLAIIAFVLWLVILVIFIALLSYDRRWKILPDQLTYTAIAVAAVYSLVYQLGIERVSFVDWVSAVALGMLPLFGVYLATYALSKGKWIGFGDVKLCLALGFLLPWWQGIIVLFLANFLGSLMAIPGMIGHKVKLNSQIAFGPCLIVATVLVFLLGWLVKGIFVFE